MSDDTNKQAGQGEKAAPDAPRYDTDYLIANARSLLGSRGPLVAGALSETNRKTHTIDQAKAALKTFMKAERPEEGAMNPEEGA